MTLSPKMILAGAGIGLLLGLAARGFVDMRKEPEKQVGEHVCSLMGRVVEIRGRLIDARTHGPRAGTGVQALPCAFEATEPSSLAAFVWRTSATRAAIAGGPAVDEQSVEAIYSEKQGHALPGDDGSFRVRVLDTWCVCTGEDPTWPDRKAIHGVIVEREGAAPWVLAPPPHGTWTKAPQRGDEHGPAYVWDLGDVVVPDP